MPNYGYHLARAQGHLIRNLYRASLGMWTGFTSHTDRQVEADVFAYSGHATLPEQVASIRSFLRCAGRPETFTVVSDGSITKEDARLLERLDRCVRVRSISEFRPDSVSPQVRHYLENHPTGKQLALIMALPVTGPTIYTDSDVLFFENARDLSQLVRDDGAAARYLPDCQLSADTRLFNSTEEQASPVNTGFLILYRKLDWEPALSRLAKLEGEPTFFTNQTLTHLTMHAHQAAPLDPTKYVLQLADQFVYPDRYARPEIALRHYVNPVRHKFWTRLPR